MSDKIRCPRCKQQMFEDARYSIIRDEMICFSGKCLNCEYEITAESLFELLMGKFDLQTEFESLVRPLEYVLSKVSSTDEEIRNRILQTLIRGYEKKAEQSDNKDEVERYLYKKIGYEQVLNGKKYNEASVWIIFGMFYFTKSWYGKAAECFEQTLSLDPASRSGVWLVYAYERLRRYDEAIRHLDMHHGTDDKLQFPSRKEAREYDQNYYFERRGELLYHKGAYEEAISFLQKVKYTPEMFRDLSDGEKREIGEAANRSVVHNISVKELMLKSFVRLKDYDQAIDTYNEMLLLDPSHEADIEEDPDLFFSVLKTLEEKDITKAFGIMQEIEPNEWWGEGGAAAVVVGYSLKGNIYLKKYSSDSRENAELLREANRCFETVHTAFEADCLGTSVIDFFGNCDNWGIQDIWETLFGSVERILPEAHIDRGLTFDKLGKPDEAFVEYRKAAEFEAYRSDNGLIARMGEAKLKMLSKTKAEFWQNIEAVEKGIAILRSSASSEAKKDSRKRILSLLESIKGSYPSVAHDLKGQIETVPEAALFKVLRTCREIVEPDFRQLWADFSEGSPDGVEENEFTQQVSRLQREGVLNSYIRSLLSLVWYVGGEVGHSRIRSLRYVQELETEDVEVLIAAALRFIAWYNEDYLKRQRS